MIMVRVIFLTISIAFISLQTARAQSLPQSTPGQVNADGVLSVAQQHLKKGEDCLTNGDLECARREFDRAIDFVLELGLDLRSEKRLHQGWHELIEKINRYQTGGSADGKALAWRTQEYEGRPVQETAEVAGTQLEELYYGPLTPEAFQLRFAELRKVFREKYGRDMVLTGADHGEHRRLYGKGSAFDIRVRDLNREQVGFIIANGNKLGLRIKDFSTWEKVAAHNARTIALGRPLDTLATGVHLHIDRMVAPKKNMVARPVVGKRQKKPSEKKTDQQ